MCVRRAWPRSHFRSAGRTQSTAGTRPCRTASGRRHLSDLQDEATVTSTWTFNTTCPNPFRCTGQVSSDQGWTVPTHSTSGTWYVTRDVDQWQPCDDGTTAPGHEMFPFYPQDATTLVGMDKTIGNSGACGHSRPLVKEFPFKLTRL